MSGLVAPVYAPCPPTFPPYGHTVMPDNDVQAFVTYSEQDRTETIVMQPAFSGTATEFGMIMPVPNRPEINEAPEDMFDVLAEYTRERIVPRSLNMEESLSLQTAESSVVILEQKDVGDFETTLLTADSAADMIKWLNDHGFEFTAEDEENFDYFVQKGGYYFVAMKINMDKADVDENGHMNGKLRPIEFVFESEHPMLPLRIMAHDMDPMRFILYTLGEFPYYIPGVDTVFMEKIEKFDYEAFQDFIMNVSPANFMENTEQFLEYHELLWEINRYDPNDKWLVRMNVSFDPREIEKNLLLERLGSGHTQPASENWRINTGLLANPGIMKGDWRNIGLETFVDAFTPYKQAGFGIPPESIECDSSMQLMLSADGQNAVCVQESSISGMTERGWQESSVRSDEIKRLS